MRHVLLIIMAVVLSIGCTPVQPEPVEPTPVQEAGCADSCARGRELKCDWAADGPGQDGDLGTKDDVPCERVCLDYEARGIDMHNDCIAAAESCQDADCCAAGADCAEDDR